MDSQLLLSRREVREKLRAVEPERGWTDAALRIHEAELRAAARNICRNDSEREDLIQDTFERALRFLSSGHPRPTQMRPWLVSILRHVFIDRMRRTAVAFVEIADEPRAVEQDPQPPWSAVSIDKVRSAVATLDPELRVPFELHYFAQLRYKDIAVQLGMPANTVATRLLRARKALREVLMRDCAVERTMP